jgi:hypothetical protein
MVNTRKRTVVSNKSKKSNKLRKYEIAYNKCIKLCKKSALKRKKSIRKRKSSLLKSRKRYKTSKSPNKRSLNAYQKFVKSESGKSIYKGKSVKSRMRAISKLWKKSK